MQFNKPDSQSNPLRAKLNDAYRADETQCVENILAKAALPPTITEKIKKRAHDLVVGIRERRLNQDGLDAFLYQYDLSSEEGIALMCLAEALLRIPDKATVDRLIRDKICRADWEGHLGQSESFFVNAATWGLFLTGKLFSQQQAPENKLRNSLKKIIAKGGEPLVRTAVGQAMKVLGKQFVMGRNINEAMERAKEAEKKGYRYSYDMLGEAARTAADAERYFQAYRKAIDEVGKSSAGKGIIDGPGISVKLSALHPRYEFAHYDICVPSVTEKLLALALQAKSMNIGLTVDAEEAERLDLSLDIIANVFNNPALENWEGFGLAVQSYQKRALPLIDWLTDLSRQKKRRLMVRLIKGAYWDSEIKMSQVRGLESYPVYTRKIATDVSFLACAKKLLAAPDAFYPQFATHNAYTLSAVLEMAGDRRDFEFQCLHGMGYTLYDQIVGEKNLNIPCRVYAPVGGHEDLLAYLVRRLLENGANTSFVNRIIDPSVPVADLIEDPVTTLQHYKTKPHPNIPLPRNIYGSNRLNSNGPDLTNYQNLDVLANTMSQAEKTTLEAKPTYSKSTSNTKKRQILDPTDNRKTIGTWIEATEDDLSQAISIATSAAEKWDLTPVTTRANYLEKAADLLEERMPQFMQIVVSEAGKTLPDAIAEVREAVDFCRYYAQQAKDNLANPMQLPGPTGEANSLTLRARGPIACISPWNFPLAIFMGQVTAALVTGNPVLAKPALQTPLIAAAAVDLLHEAGIPKDVLQLIPASGKLVGSLVVSDPRIKGIIFTGSTETARTINQTLANRPGPIIPFIAETGGQNAMIVDSSALPEQVVADVIISAFGSTGQRCSALRVLFLQDDIADKLIHMLQGAMQELRVGDPSELATDIGPLIDHAAKKTMEEHAEKMKHEAKLIHQVALTKETANGSFFAPCAFEISDISVLTREVFGPILHIVRYKENDLDKVIDAINNTGYGLTLGIHSRIDATIEHIHKRAHVGNTYVNRTMIGAVVGVQPFGGENLSGTGPKAGGPHYLTRLCTERTLSINTTAAGGNATLMSLSENAVA